MMPSPASSSHSTRPASCLCRPRSAQHLGWEGIVITTCGGLKAQTCDSRNFFTRRCLPVALRYVWTSADATRRGSRRSSHRAWRAAARPRCARSNAFAVSYSDSAATVAAVSASISTPVRSCARTVACTRIRPVCASGSSSISAPVTRIGWQCGKRRGVSFTPIMPATFAVSSGMPFFVPATRCWTASAVVTSQDSATASRSVSGFAPTSTMRVTPSAPAWSEPTVSPPRSGRASRGPASRPAPSRCRSGSSRGRSARETVEMRFEPRPPVGVADQPSAPRATTTRANCSLPTGPLTSCVSVARHLRPAHLAASEHLHQGRAARTPRSSRTR